MRFFRRPIKDLRGASDLADSLGKRLAFLASEQQAELVLSRQNFVADLLENVVALLDAGLRPSGECSAGSGNRVFGFVARCARIGADHLVGIGRIAIFGCVGALHPATGYEILMHCHATGSLLGTLATSA
jgi:hypothetical protein